MKELCLLFSQRDDSSNIREMHQDHCHRICNFSSKRHFKQETYRDGFDQTLPLRFGAILHLEYLEHSFSRASIMAKEIFIIITSNYKVIEDSTISEIVKQLK
ncbi:hypothetical protein Y032_0099g3146 [Ancylostoma ceylanicum]|uniref:Uncharacterized protein n=1 Tax=Ancylostoma ceylanicum TaxID=53326 RepID=A0A016TIK4_9BILA|nr:hypothetical protein Y032_0099g3146 [Ancylostoma ceylanicum]